MQTTNTSIFLMSGLVLLCAVNVYADDFYTASAKDSSVQVAAAKRVEIAKSHREKMQRLRTKYQQSTTQEQKKKILAEISAEKSAYMKKLREKRALCKKASKQKSSVARTAATNKSLAKKSSEVSANTAVKKTSVAKQTSCSNAATVKHVSSKAKVAKASEQKPVQDSTNEGAAVTPCQAYTVMVEAAEFDDALLDYSDEELDASIEQPPLTIEGEEE